MQYKKPTKTHILRKRFLQINFFSNFSHKNLLQTRNTRTRDMRHAFSGGFSMMELLFVLVILGILASLALPRISFSRNNALSVAIQSDIQTIISSTQEYAITNEFMPQNATPQWLLSYLHLSPKRWVVAGDSLKIAKDGALDSQNDCLSIRFDQTNYLQIVFNRAQNTNLCQTLFKNYASDMSIPLHIAP